MFRPSLVEARDSRFVLEAEASSYLTAPTTAYPVDGAVVALPSDLEGDKGPYVEQALEEQILGHDYVVFFGPADNRFGEVDFSALWHHRLEREGYERLDAPDFARLRVDLWIRR